MQNLDGESGYVTAALGNTWSHSVNTRLIVQYLDGGRREVGTVNDQLKHLKNVSFNCGQEY